MAESWRELRGTLGRDLFEGGNSGGPIGWRWRDGSWVGHGSWDWRGSGRVAGSGMGEGGGHDVALGARGAPQL